MTTRPRPTDDVEPTVTSRRRKSGTSTGTTDEQPALRGYGFVVAVLAAFLAVGAAVAGLSGTVRHQIAISLTRQPEKYTVLYFSDGLKWAGAGTDRVIMTVSFTVVNHEGRRTRFPYAVQVLDPAKTPIARSEGSVDIPDGKDATAAVDVNVPASAGWSAVEVNLVGRAEHIRLRQSSSEATNN